MLEARFGIMQGPAAARAPGNSVNCQAQAFIAINGKTHLKYN